MFNTSKKSKDKLISRRAKNRGTTFIQWTCHSLILIMQLLNWVAWVSSLDGSQHRHFSGLRQEKINSQLSYYNVFLSLRQLEMILISSVRLRIAIGFTVSWCPQRTYISDIWYTCHTQNSSLNQMNYLSYNVTILAPCIFSTFNSLMGAWFIS